MKKNYLLILVLVLMFLIGSLSFIKGGYSPFMYDEKEVSKVSSNLLLKNSYLINDNNKINSNLNYPVLTSNFSIWSYDLNKSVPVRMVGIYLYTVISKIIFGNYYFLFFPIIFLMSSLIFLNIIKNIKIFKGNKICFLGFLFFITFFPFVLWSNSALSVSLAFYFFLVFILFFIKYLDKENNNYIYLGGIMISLASLVRYEYFIFGFFLYIFLLIHYKKSRKNLINIIFSGFFTILVFVGLLFLNKSWFGGYFDFNFLQRNIVVPLDNNQELLETISNNSGLSSIEKFKTVFFTDFFNIKRLLKNINNNFIYYFWFYILFTFFSLVHFCKNNKIYKYYGIILIPFFFWGYYSYIGNFWGSNEYGWIINSHIRYSFPLFFLLLLGTIYFFYFFLIKNRKLKISFFFLLLLIFINFNFLFKTPYGLDEIFSQREYSCFLNLILEEYTPKNSLVIAPHDEIFIEKREVISPWYITKNKKEIPIYLLKELKKIYEKNSSIYYIKNKFHKSSSLALDKEFNKNNFFNLKKIKEFDGFILYKIMVYNYNHL